MYGGLKASEALRKGAPSEHMMTKIALGLMQPEGRMMRKQMQAGQVQRQREYLQNIEDLLRRSRREQLMGRRGFFDPERMDEQLYGAAIKQQQAAQERARQDAINRMQQAYQMHQSLVPLQQQRLGMKGTKTAMGGQVISGIGRAIGGSGAGGPGQLNFGGGGQSAGGAGGLGGLGGLFGGGQAGAAQGAGNIAAQAGSGAAGGLGGLGNIAGMLGGLF